MISLNGHEVNTYDKTDTKWYNLLLVMIKQFKNSLASEADVSMRTYIPKLDDVTPFGSFVWVIFRERYCFEQLP